MDIANEKLVDSPSYNEIKNILVYIASYQLENPFIKSMLHVQSTTSKDGEKSMDFNHVSNDDVNSYSRSLSCDFPGCYVKVLDGILDFTLGIQHNVLFVLFVQEPGIFKKEQKHRIYGKSKNVMGNRHCLRNLNLEVSVQLVK